MRRLVAAAVLLALVLACSRNNGASLPPAGPDPNPVVEAQMRQHAQEALAQWDTRVAEWGRHNRVYAPTYGVEMVNDSGQILNGRPLTFDADAPATIPPTVLTWPDGSSRTALGLTAKQAFDELVKYTYPPVCGGCPAAHVTGASLVSRSLAAVGGPVTAPAWEFTFAGFADHAIVPSVHPDEVLHPVPATDSHRDGIQPDKAWTDADGRRLTVQFIGAPNGASGPCGEDYTLEPVFSDHAAVIIIHTHRYHPPSGQPDRAIACPMSGSLRQGVVDLPEPLGGRVLIDAVYGLGVPLFRSIQ